MDFLPPLASSDLIIIVAKCLEIKTSICQYFCLCDNVRSTIFDTLIYPQHYRAILLWIYPPCFGQCRIKTLQQVRI